MRHEIEGTDNSSTTPYAFQQNGSTTISPFEGTKSISERVKFTQVFARAIVLIDNYWISDIIHLDIVERYTRNGPGSTLPCLDPYTIVGKLDERVSNRNIGDACTSACEIQYIDIV